MLKLLAAECEFDAFLDQALRDIFAIGIGDRETQRKLREANQLTFAKAVEIALARESISRELSGTSDKDAAGGMHALGHSSSGQGQTARSAAERRKHRRLQVLSLRPEPSRVDMQVQAVRMSRMPQKGSSQVNVPQQSQVPRHANVRGRGRRGRDLGIFHTNTPVKASKEPWSTTMVIDQVPVRMEIDTGSGKSLIGKDSWKQSFPKKKLRETPVNITTYSGEKLPLLGTCLAEVQHQWERHRLELLVADVTDQLPIIGRDWFSKIKIDWKGMFHIKSRTLQQVLDKHEAVFEKGLGTMKKFKASCT